MALIISMLSFFLLLLSSLVAVASAAGYGNVNAPNSELPSAPYARSDDYKAKEQILDPLTVAVQGIVYCKSGTNNKLTPLKGMNRVYVLGYDIYIYIYIDGVNVV